MDEDGGASKDFLDDLHFLIATDGQLSTDLSFVCDLLNDNSSSDRGDDASSLASDDSVGAADHPAGPFCTETKHSHARARTSSTKTSKTKASVDIEYPPTGAKNRFQYRQKQEMQQLREQVDALKMTLAAAVAANPNAMAVMARRPSVWEAAAKQERLDCKRALDENADLKGALSDQATFIDHMQRLFKKRPRTSNATVETQSDAWQSYKLAAQRSLRTTAIHAIADRQLRRMQSALIQAGVFHEPNDKFFAAPRSMGGHRLVLDFAINVRIPAPYRIVSASCWQVLGDACDPSLPVDAFEESEFLDAHTVYRQFSQVVGRIATHSNVIRKYYLDDHQDVILWRTVLEDALVPHLARGAVDNEWGWLVVAPIADDPSSCRVTFLHQVLVETNPAFFPPGLTAMEVTSDAIKRFRFCEQPPVPGRFSGTPAEEDVDISDNIMKVFMSKGKRLELALCAAVENAVLVAQSGGTQ